MLGRAYTFSLSQFANAAGKKGRNYYTACRGSQLLVERLKPYRDGIDDPCYGSSDRFLPSVEFIRTYAKARGNYSEARADIPIHGQQSNYTTGRLADVSDWRGALLRDEKRRAAGGQRQSPNPDQTGSLDS